MATVKEPILYHWSALPVERLDSRPYKQGLGMKPNGLWFDCDEDWVRWCRAEEFGLPRLAFRHRVEVLDLTRILKLCTAEDLAKFTLKFRQSDNPYIWSIDWPDIRDKFSGIIIAPYIWECRLDDRAFWYYSWDCASGCVWDIGNIRLGPPEAMTDGGKP
jgi:hypothetical protein